MTGAGERQARPDISPEARPSVHFGLLGALLVEDDEGVRTIGAPRQRALLAALLLNANKPVQASELIEQVWNQRPPQGAVATLHSYLSRLRRILGATGERIQTCSDGYRVATAPNELDVDRFAAHRDRARQATLAGKLQTAADEYEAALGVWRGTPLADVPEMPWREDAVGFWSEQRILTIEEHLAVQVRLGRLTDAIPGLRAFVRDHPFREESAARLLTALAEAGRRAEALAEYRRIRRVMVDEAGVEPGEALRSVHRQLLDEDRRAGDPVAPERVVPGQLLPRLSDFTGRDAELRQVAAAITAVAPGAAPAVVVVSGPGGIGKTTFAVHLGHRMRTLFPDGQVFVRLGGLRAPRRAADIAAEILRSLGADSSDIPAGLDERTALLRSTLSDRRVLVVLDDASESAQVRPLLPGAAPASVIVTTRSRLPGLSGQLAVELAGLTNAEARALLDGLVGEDRAAGEPAALSDVIETCAGLPIALRICGARLALRRAWSIESFAERLRNLGRRLDELATEDLAVRSCLDESYRALTRRGGDPGSSADPARVFRMLSLIGGEHFDIHAAAATTGADAVAVDAVLEHLVEMNLLEAVGPREFGFHPLIRELAREHCESADSTRDRGEAVHRWAMWCLAAAAAADLLINPERTRTAWEAWLPALPSTQTPFQDRQSALEWFDRGSGCLVDAVSAASNAGDHAITAALPLVILHGFRVRGRIGDLEGVHLAGIAAATVLDEPELHGVLLNNLAIVYGSTQRFDEAISAFESALAQFQRAGLPGRVAQIRVNVAITVRRQGNSARAVDLLVDARAMIRSLEGTAAWSPVTAHLQSTSALALAEALTDTGRIAEAQAVFHELVASAEAAGYTTILSLAWGNLANLESRQGRFEDALPMIEKALALQRADGNRDGEAHSLWVLGDIRKGLGDVTGTREAWQAACRIYSELGQAESLSGLAAELAELAEPDAADQAAAPAGGRGSRAPAP